MIEKMKKTSEDGLCRMFENGEYKAKIPIPRLRENVECVQYGCDVYIHTSTKPFREHSMLVAADNLFQQSMGIISKTSE